MIIMMIQRLILLNWNMQKPPLSKLHFMQNSSKKHPKCCCATTVKALHWNVLLAHPSYRKLGCASSSSLYKICYVFPLSIFFLLHCLKLIWVHCSSIIITVMLTSFAVQLFLTLVLQNAIPTWHVSVSLESSVFAQISLVQVIYIVHREIFATFPCQVVHLLPVTMC